MQRDGAYSPAYYAYYGPNETSEAIRAIFERVLDRDAAILELGCSVGRHLAHLEASGFTNLSGIEINEAALDVMAETYPSLAAEATIHLDAIETVVPTIEDDAFDAIFSVETLQHLHPDAEWIFPELARITDGLLVTAENERREDETNGDEHERPQRDGTTEPGTDEQRASRNSGRDDRPSVDPRLKVVDGELPLYYRDWNRIFTDEGFEAVAVDSVGNDTIRTFRHSG